MKNKNIIFHNGSISELPTFIKSFGFRKVLLVRGQQSFKGSESEKAVDLIRPQVRVKDIFGFGHNPNISDTKKAVQKLGSFTPDIVVAIGGGSVIDMAKLIRTTIETSLEEVLRNVTDGHPLNGTLRVPMLAIPTTAGTGSEVTSFAVVYINGVKFSLSGERVKPDYVLIDPKLTLSLSKSVTAESGLDALCQGIESYWSVNSTKSSQSYALNAIQAAICGLEKAVNRPTLGARYQMCVASHNAGMAIDVTKTTAAHAVSYPLTIHFGIAHGHAVALTLPEFFILNHSRHRSFKERIRREVIIEEYVRREGRLYSALEVECARSAGLKIYNLIEDIGLDSDLRKLGVDKKNHHKIIEEVNLDRLGNNPTLIGDNHLREVLRQPLLRSRLS